MRKSGTSNASNARSGDNWIEEAKVTSLGPPQTWGAPPKQLVDHDDPEESSERVKKICVSYTISEDISEDHQNKILSRISKRNVPIVQEVRTRGSSADRWNIRTVAGAKPEDKHRVSSTNTNIKSYDQYEHETTSPILFLEKARLAIQKDVRKALAALSTKGTASERERRAWARQESEAFLRKHKAQDQKLELTHNTTHREVKEKIPHKREKMERENIRISARIRARYRADTAKSIARREEAKAKKMRQVLENPKSK
jgi:hypothetical protein